MDCLQKWSQYDENGIKKTAYEAICCDAPCEGDYAMNQPDVGAGCIVKDLGQEGTETGTKCASFDYDLGCPDPDEPLPPVTPKDPTPEPPDGEGQVPGGHTPIVIDVGGAGYRFTSVAQGVRFDVRNDGTPVQISWTRLGVENAFLALDRNGNGRIDSGAELFGDHTPLRSGGTASNGFVALAECDENHDGVVDSGDIAWEQLLLWTDRNHDGMSTGDELQPIATSAVSALETEYLAIGRRDQWGNAYRFSARLRTATGSGEKYYDVILQTQE
ncbi:MAG TPA: hypothetical protein VF266_01130 [Thermoanaerobaculia bacterium]